MEQAGGAAFLHLLRIATALLKVTSALAYCLVPCSSVGECAPWSLHKLRCAFGLSQSGDTAEISTGLASTQLASILQEVCKLANQASRPLLW